MSEILETWHFTKENYREGVPRPFRHKKEISFFSSGGGEVIGGEYYREGRWIEFEENAMLHLLSDGRIYHIPNVPPPLSRTEQWKRRIREWIENLF